MPRSTYARCHGDRGALRTSLMFMTSACCGTPARRSHRDPEANMSARCRTERLRAVAALSTGPSDCHVKVDNTTSIVRENDEDEADFKPNRVDGEEVDGSELRYMIVEERFPRLRW